MERLLGGWGMPAAVDSGLKFSGPASLDALPPPLPARQCQAGTRTMVGAFLRVGQTFPYTKGRQLVS